MDEFDHGTQKSTILNDFDHKEKQIVENIERKEKNNKRRKSSTSVAVLETAIDEHILDSNSINGIEDFNSPQDNKEQEAELQDVNSLNSAATDTSRIVSKSFEYLQNFEYGEDFKHESYIKDESFDENSVVAMCIDDSIFDDISLNTPRDSLQKVQRLSSAPVPSKQYNLLRSLFKPNSNKLQESPETCNINNNKWSIVNLPEPKLEDKDYVIEEYSTSEKWRILRNLAVMSFTGMLMFTAINGITLVESASVPLKNDVLEIATSSTLHGTQIIFAILFSTITVRYFGCKLSVTIFCAMSIPYAAAQYYSEYYTLLPTAFLTGCATTIFWCAAGTYTAILSQVYSEVTNSSLKLVTIRFFSMFYFIFSFATIWANLVTLEGIPIVNNDMSNTSCGTSSCLHKNSQLFSYVQSERTEYALISCYIVLMLVACFLINFGIDDLNRYNLRTKNYELNFRTMYSTIMQLKEFKIWFLLPTAVWFGAQEAFFEENFLQSFVACSIGYHHVPYISICYGLTYSLTSLAVGLSTYIIKPQVILVCIATLLNTAVLITLFVWMIQSSHVVMFYLLIVLWGIGISTWNIQLSAFCGLKFPSAEEEIFSNVLFWRTLVCFTLTSFSGEICSEAKLYVVIILTLYSFAAFVFSTQNKNSPKL